MVDFGVIGVFLLHLFVMLLFFLPALIIQCLQELSSLVLLHHFIALKFLVPLLVKILQVTRSLNKT